MKKVLKSFFGLCFSKVLIAFLIFIVLAPFIYYDNGLRCIRAPCPSESLGSFVNLLVFSYNNSHIHISYPLLIAGIIVSYLIACIFVVIFSNTRYVNFCRYLNDRN